MTIHQRDATFAAASCVLASAAAGVALGLVSLSWGLAAILAALPGFGIVWLWRHPAPIGPDAQPVAAATASAPRVVRSSMWVVLALAVASATPPLRASDDPVFSRYRDLTLGDSVPAVIETLKARLVDIKIVQERPTLVQQLTWRRPRYVSGATVVVDPLDELVLTFHLGQLARISAGYDPTRIEGLTGADLTAALSGVYGAPMLPSRSSRTPGVAPGPADTLGQWSDGETLVTLGREGNPRQLRLTIATLVADAAMQQALADGAAIAASEAPAKDLARRAADAAALQARAERIRRDNKASFKP
jgi:hypothetical protein